MARRERSCFCLVLGNLYEAILITPSNGNTPRKWGPAFLWLCSRTGCRKSGLSWREIPFTGKTPTHQSKRWPGPFHMWSYLFLLGVPVAREAPDIRLYHRWGNSLLFDLEKNTQRCLHVTCDHKSLQCTERTEKGKAVTNIWHSNLGLLSDWTAPPDGSLLTGGNCSQMSVSLCQWTGPLPPAGVTCNHRRTLLKDPSSFPREKTGAASVKSDPEIQLCLSAWKDLTFVILSVMWKLPIPFLFGGGLSPRSLWLSA